MIEFGEARRIAEVLAAIGEATRLRILHQLTRGPHHVGRLAEVLGVPTVNLSHHLGVMRQAGLIEDTKYGRRLVYSLRPDVYAPGGGPGVIGTLTAGVVRLVLLDGHGPIADGTPVRRAAGRRGAK